MNVKHAKELDRRPIAARNMKFSTFMTDRLAVLGVSPNAISVWSIVFGCLSGAAFWATSCPDAPQGLLFFTAAFFILLRLLANMFDGMVAVKTGTSSAVGELYNEVPDRISDSVIMIGAGYALSGWDIAGYLAALCAMLTAYVRAVGKGAGARQEFCGPLAKQQRMFLLIVTALFLAAAPETWRPDFQWPAGRGLLAVVLMFIAVGSFYTTWRRLKKINQALLRGAI